ncbi:MAG: hypothetical protein IKK43_06835 [Clostridia bacterium]|nr:hypothetical protein [Clostridia bacterium]
MTYDFTNEMDKAKVRETLYRFQLKLIAISGVFSTYDINCANIGFEYVLDELKNFKRTEDFNLLMSYRDFICQSYGPNFMTLFSDESISALCNGPKKICDLVKVNSILGNAISLISQVIAEMESNH